MTDYTAHEQALMARMRAHNQELMPLLNDGERKSMESYVTVDNLADVEEMIGTDDHIEQLLFWDKGGKFDDPDWKRLAPVSEADGTVTAFFGTKLAELRAAAVTMQRRCDLTLFSQFNTGLLFTGLAGAVRCDGDGNPEPTGDRYRGVELRLIGSVREHYGSVCVMPEPDGGYLVHYGAHENGVGVGNVVNSGDAFTLIQLAQMMAKDFEKAGLSALLTNARGEVVALDAKAIRRAAKNEEPLGYDATLTLVSERHVATLDEAYQTACALSRIMYERFGLETEVFNLGRQYGNFSLCRNEDFEQFMEKAATSGKKGLVFFTATLVCRRCRREVEGFAIMAARYPDVQFALVNMNAPHGKFHTRVFGDLAGGDPDQFVQVAKGVTPFTIVYTADGKGGLQYREYFATGKTDAPPTPEFACAVLDGYFG